MVFLENAYHDGYINDETLTSPSISLFPILGMCPEERAIEL